MPFIYLDERVGGRPFNVLRKAWHVLGLIFPLALYLDIFGSLGPQATRFILLAGLTLFLGVLLATDLARFRYPAFSRLYRRLFAALMKPEETQHFNASVPYIAANIVLFAVCNTEALVLSALFLNLGDAAASWLGSRFGRLRFWNGRSLAGTLAFVGFASGFGLLFLALHSSAPSTPQAWRLWEAGTLQLAPVLVVVFGATFAAIAELFSLTGLRGLVDDNLWVPPAGLLGMGLVLGAQYGAAPAWRALFWF